MEALRSSETFVFTRVKRRHIPKDDILHSHRLENLKYYIVLFLFLLLRSDFRKEEFCVSVPEKRGFLVGMQLKIRCLGGV
jgi:hypothetical protein